MVIKDNVQGVGFRRIVLNEARKLGIVGYIENMDDGTFCINTDK